MAKPIRPVAPPLALRSNPATFSANAESNITYQFEALPNWMDALGDFVDDRAEQAEAAVLVGDVTPAPDKAHEFIRFNAAGDALVSAGGFLPKGAPIYITTSGTYTPSAGTRAIVVQVQGAGGGGGGVSGGGTGTAGCASGGAAGGISEKFITLIAASYTCAIGAAGAGASAGANTGGAGGNTTFVGTGVSIAANGGNGGNGVAGISGNTSVGGSFGGDAIGGDINVKGAASIAGHTIGGAIANRSNGADGQYGAGGLAVLNVNGEAASGYGAGGAGAAIISQSFTRGGGNGAPGLIIITEYR